MLSSASDVGGVLTIEGDSDAPNRVALRVTTRRREQWVVAVVNGQRSAFPLGALTAITVTGGDARDIVKVAPAIGLPVTVDGRGGADVLTGGRGSDTLRGGGDNDVIRGGGGNDYLDGGEGNNRLFGGGGVNTLVNLVPGPDPVVPPPVGQIPPAPAPPAPPPVLMPPESRRTALLRADGTIQPFGVPVTGFANGDGTLVQPNDGKDDTVGLQRAIDSLDAQWGIPDAVAPRGGTLFLPAGEYQTSAPLRLPGTVILSGDGDGTVVHYTGTAGSAIELVESNGVPYASAAGVQNLTVRADAAGGVGVSATRKLVLLQLRFRDVTLDTAGWGINFQGHQTQNSFFENVTLKNPGSGALRIEGNANKVLGVRTEGPVRAGFKADPAVIVVKGDLNRIADCVVAPLPAGAGSAFYVSGYFPSLGNNRAEVAGVVPTVSDGVAYTFENVEGGTVDDLWGRRARFVRAVALRVGRQWAGLDADRLSQLLHLDTDSDIILDEVAGPDVAGGAARAEALAGDPRARVARWAAATDAGYFGAIGRLGNPSTTPPRAVGEATFGVNVRDFFADDGRPAAGDGVRDDTTAVQRAIDSLAVPHDVTGGTAVGGVVYLPAGDYVTTAPLRVPDGVVLVGDGNSTLIRYVGQGAAVQFYSPVPGGTVTGAGVENLSVNAESAAAIGASAGATLDRVRVQDVVLNCLGWGVDLRGVTTRNSAFDNVHQRNLGAGSVWVEGNGNRLFAVNTEFGVRPGFAAEPALLVVKGNDNAIVGSVIEGVPDRSASAIYVSGTGLYWAYNWAEIHHSGFADAKNGDAFVFENVRDVVHVDNLYILGTKHRGRFINSQVRIAQISSVAENLPLKGFLTVDAASHLDIEWSISYWWGTGPLDGTAVQILNLFKKALPPI